MKLRSIRIQNYKSLEDVTLEDIGQVNVIIGRNNMGKSSIFSLLRELPTLIKNRSKGFADNLRFRRSIPVRLEVQIELSSSSIREFLKKHAIHETEKITELAPQFLGRVKFLIELGSDHWSWLETSIYDAYGDWLRTQQAHDKGADKKGANDWKLEYRDIVNGFLIPRFNTIRTMADLGRSFIADITKPSVVNTSNPASLLPTEPIGLWVLDEVLKYLKSAYWFDPYRHSNTDTAVRKEIGLSSNGANLPQVLHTLQTTSQSTFRQVEKFMNSALPNIGSLQTPIDNVEMEDGSEVVVTSIAFETPDPKLLIKLVEMGGGVEQLLMMATVLETTSRDCPLFLEEPESHLHPGAQRYLLEHLATSGRQVFITTHSPLFVNSTNDEHRVYRFHIDQGIAKIGKAVHPSDLSATLRDLGARNSDLLFSDAVLFVEGTSDQVVIEELSLKLGFTLSEQGISILSLGGTLDIRTTGPVRIKLLNEIAQESQIPYLLVVDRDHRLPSEVTDLKQRLKDTVHVLERRELENYLLVSHAILDALRDRFATDKEKSAQLSRVSELEIQQCLGDVIESLRSRVLIKRIQASLGGLLRGFLERETAERLIPLGDGDKNALIDAIHKAVSDHIGSQYSKARLRSIVNGEIKKLDQEWKDQATRWKIVPGADALELVFKKYGAGTFHKEKDGRRIARAMKVEDINQELKDLLERIRTLSGIQ